MFLRPFRVKSNTIVKGSERKRIKSAVSSLFPCLSSSHLNGLLPSKCILAVARLLLHSGSVVSIYIVDRQPLFFEEDGRIYPTVYSLWYAGDFIPCVTTWPPVLVKLQSGADLMLPGVVGSCKGGCDIQGIVKGQCCAVNLLGNRSAIGVGVSLMSSEEMQSCGMRGKGFRMVHLYGDNLWEMGSKIHPPVVVMGTHLQTGKEDDEAKGKKVREEKVEEKEEEEEMEEEEEEDEGLMQGLALLEIEGDCDDIFADSMPESKGSPESSPRPGDSVLRPEPEPPHSTLMSSDARALDTKELGFPEDHSPLMAVSILKSGTHTHQDVAESRDDDGGEGSGEEEDELGTGNVISSYQGHDACAVGAEATGVSMVMTPDDLLVECFFRAVSSKVMKTALPILTSTFYRSHMLAQCPPGFHLDIKKTSYKKVSRFLQAMQGDGMLELKESSPGVESIVAINFKHTRIKGFIPRPLATAKTEGQPLPTPAKTRTITIRELYMPSHKLLPVFIPLGYSKQSALEQTGVREAITAYVRTNELTSPETPRIVTLDPILSDALHQKGEPYISYLSWQELMTRTLQQMRPAYSISNDANQTAVRKGKLEPVRLTLAQRTGNKKVTLVDNLQTYNISPVELSHCVQKMVAASSTVSEVAGHPGLQQVLVQGDAVKVVSKLLQDQYAIPIKYIEAINKLKQPKKKTGKKR